MSLSLPLGYEPPFTQVSLAKFAVLAAIFQAGAPGPGKAEPAVNRLSSGLPRRFTRGARRWNPTLGGISLAWGLGLWDNEVILRYLDVGSSFAVKKLDPFKNSYRINGSRSPPLSGPSLVNSAVALHSPAPFGGGSAFFASKFGRVSCIKRMSEHHGCNSAF